MIRFDFDILKLVSQYVPPLLRKPKLLSFLYTLFAPLVSFHEEVKSFVEQQRKEAAATGQTIWLEELLNDHFDPEKRRIYVAHQMLNYTYKYTFVEQGNNYKYKQAESIAIYKYFSYEVNSALPDNADFMVVAPPSVSSYLYKYKVNEGFPTYKYLLSEGVFLYKYTTQNDEMVSRIYSFVKKYTIAGKKAFIKT